MGDTALVTGAAARVDDVSAALEQAGYKVMRVPEPGDVAGVCAGLEPGTLDCYVQLPKETTVDAPSLIGRVQQFLASGLLARFDQAATVVPCLAKDGCVVFVAGNLPGELNYADWQREYLSLTSEE